MFAAAAPAKAGRTSARIGARDEGATASRARMRAVSPTLAAAEPMAARATPPLAPPNPHTRLLARSASRAFPFAQLPHPTFSPAVSPADFAHRFAHGSREGTGRTDARHQKFSSRLHPSLRAAKRSRSSASKPRPAAPPNAARAKRTSPARAPAARRGRVMRNGGSWTQNGAKLVTGAIVKAAPRNRGNIHRRFVI